jgi:hypothetical protein
VEYNGGNLATQEIGRELNHLNLGVMSSQAGEQDSVLRTEHRWGLTEGFGLTEMYINHDMRLLSSTLQQDGAFRGRAVR